jgi:hypothetical protein
MATMQHPGKWYGAFFNVVLHWYKQFKEYIWLKLIGLLPTQTLCLMQRAVDDVLLEYMQQNDHIENTYRKNSLTYAHALETRSLICSYHESMVPECEHKVVTDDLNVIVHAAGSK